MTKEEVIKCLKDIAQEKKIVNTKAILAHSNSLQKGIYKYFESLQEALKAADIHKNVQHKISEKECETEIKRLYSEYHMVNSKIIKQYGKIGLNTYAKKYGSLRQALIRYDIPYKQSANKNISKQELDEEIHRIINKYGYISKPIVEKYSKFGPKIINRIYGSFGHMYEVLGIKRHPSGRIPTTQALLDDCKKIYEEEGYLNKTLIEQKSNYSATCYHERFGSINVIREKLGLEKHYAGECQEANRIIDKISKILNETPIKEKKFDWLKNPLTNQSLRIDAYYNKANIGIEYNGPQHYIVDDRYTKTQEELEYRQYLDKLKIDLAKEHGIKIITIPYTIKITDQYLQTILN